MITEEPAFETCLASALSLSANRGSRCRDVSKSGRGIWPGGGVEMLESLTLWDEESVDAPGLVQIPSPVQVSELFSKLASYNNTGGWLLRI